MTADPITAPVPVPEVTGGEPTVSVVITCYNYGRFLAEAIESALAQTRPADEIVIVDDGSTDDSLEVARRYAHLGQVRIVTQANQGAVATFNRGVSTSTGTYFVMLSADDRMDTQYLEHTVPSLRARPDIAYVYTAYRCFGAQQSIFPAEPYDRLRLTKRPYISGTALIRRAVFDQVGGYSSEMHAGYEDWDLYLTLAEYGWSGAAISDVLFQYRIHAGSRNSMSIRTWLSLMSLLYQRHRSLYSMSRQAFLCQAVVNRAWRRIQRVPEQFLGRAVRRIRRPQQMRACMLVSNAVENDMRVRREARSVADVVPLTVLGQSKTAAVTVQKRNQDGYRVLLMPRKGSDPATTSDEGGNLPVASTILNLLALNARLAVQAFYERAAVYHAHDLDTLPAAVVAATLNGSTLIYDSHELWPDMSPTYARRVAWRILERALMPRVDTLITINRSIASELRRRYGKLAVVLHNYPDVPSSTVAADHEKIEWRHTAPERVVVRYHGVFLAERGLEELLRAMSLLDDRVTLTLQGYGPLEASLRRLTDELCIKDRVSFLGPIAGSDMVRVARQADIGVVLTRPTSLNHRLSTPSKVYEFMQAGLALVVSDLPELRAIVEATHAGVCCDPEDPRSIANVIQRFASDAAGLRAYQAASLAAAPRYRWEHEAPRLVSLYRDMLAITQNA